MRPSGRTIGASHRHPVGIGTAGCGNVALCLLPLLKGLIFGPTDVASH